MFPNLLTNSFDSLKNQVGQLGQIHEQITKDRGYGPLTDQEVQDSLNTNNPLGGGKYAVKNLVFPVGLGEPPYHHYMMLFINESRNTQYPKPLDEATKGLDNLVPDNPSSVLSSVNLHTKTETGVEGPGVIQRPTRRISTAIGLFMPANINTSHSNDWGEVSTGIVGDLIQDIALKPGGTKEGAMHFIEDLKQSLGKNLLQRGIGNAIGADIDLYSPASLVARGAYNPHQEILYNGPKFRQFSFQWNFVPKNEDETNRIKDIVKVLSFYQAPEINKGQGGRYFIYPAEFDIAFYSGKRENPFIKRISTCALTNIQVSYAPAFGSFQAFRNGSPTQTSLSLSFVELELITKNLVSQGY